MRNLHKGLMEENFIVLGINRSFKVVLLGYFMIIGCDCKVPVGGISLLSADCEWRL